MNKAVTIVYLITVLFFLFIFLRIPDLFIYLVEEDQLVEWSTFSCYLLASLVFFYVTFIRQKKTKHFQWFFLVMAIGCILVSGEEISWGQRIFGFQTPKIIAEHNIQQELTLHNLGEFSQNWPRRLYMILLFLYLIVLPWMYSISRRLKAIVDTLGIAIPPLVLVVPFVCSLVLPLYIKILITLGQELPRYHMYTVEVMELFSGFLFLHFAVLELTRTRYRTELSA